MEVEVLTTCATDYVTWRNELPPGIESINGVPVRRFRVKRERDPRLFGRRSDRVFEQPHSLGDELDWLHGMWNAKPVWWLLQWPVVGHGHAHVGEAISVRNRMGLSGF